MAHVAEHHAMARRLAAACTSQKRQREVNRKEKTLPLNWLTKDVVIGSAFLQFDTQKKKTGFSCVCHSVPLTHFISVLIYDVGEKKMQLVVRFFFFLFFPSKLRTVKYESHFNNTLNFTNLKKHLYKRTLRGRLFQV